MTLIRKIAWKIWKIVKYTFVLLGFCAICIIIWIGFSLVYNKVETYAPFGWRDNFEDCQLALQRRQERYPDYVTEIDERYFLAWTNYGLDDGYEARLCDRQEQKQSWSFTSRHIAASSDNLIAIPYYNSFCRVRIVRLNDAKRETSLSINSCNGRIENLVWNDDLLAVVGNRNSYGIVDDLVVEIWDVPENILVRSIEVGDADWNNMTFENSIITIGDKQFTVNNGN